MVSICRAATETGAMSLAICFRISIAISSHLRPMFLAQFGSGPMPSRATASVPTLCINVVHSPGISAVGKLETHLDNSISIGGRRVAASMKRCSLMRSLIRSEHASTSAIRVRPWIGIPSGERVSISWTASCISTNSS